MIVEHVMKLNLLCSYTINLEDLAYLPLVLMGGEVVTLKYN